MGDRLTRAERSAQMARIRKTNSKPELALRAALRSAGIRFRTYSKVTGTPDIVLTDYRVAVFVHGCFWHGCPHHYRRPKTNLAYWIPKLERNKRRDARTVRALRREGWSVVTVWECRALADSSAAAKRIRRAATRIAALTEANAHAKAMPRGTTRGRTQAWSRGKT